MVHHLVAQAFIGDRPEGQLVLHWDDDKRNNNVENLRYGTHKENIADAYRNGIRKTKLTAENRAEIVRERLAGAPLRVVAERYDIHPTMVSKLALGHRKVVV